MYDGCVVDFKSIKKGSEQALKKLISSYWKILYKFAVTFILDKEVAKEIVQDTFFVVWERRETLDDNLNLKQFLFRIVRNKCLNYLRDLRLETISVDLLEWEDIYLRSNSYVLEDNVVEKLFLEDLENIIQQSLQNLPLLTQEIFVLSRKEHLTNKEIANMKNISEKSVEYHISKMIRQIKSDLPEEYHYLIWLLLTYYFVV